MPKKSESHEDERAAIMFALAESVAEASDEEILEETRSQGEDPTEAAGHVRSVFLHAATAWKERENTRA